MLENAPGYAAWMALEGEAEQPSTAPNWLNKKAMKNYMFLFEEGREIIDMKQRERAAKGNVTGSFRNKTP